MLETRGGKGTVVFQVSCANGGEGWNEVYKETHVYGLTPQVNNSHKAEVSAYGSTTFFLAVSPSKGFTGKQNLGVAWII